MRPPTKRESSNLTLEKKVWPTLLYRIASTSNVSDSKLRKGESYIYHFGHRKYAITI